MKLEIMALYDAKAEAYMTPFFAQTVGAAMRGLSDLVNDIGPQKGEAPSLHPEDFSLWRLGTWWDEGKIELEQAPVQVALCINLKRERTDA